MWNIESKSYVKKVDLINKTDLIKDCLVLPGYCYENKLVIILTQEGRLDVYNTESSQLVANLNSSNFTHNQSQVINEQKLSQICCAANSGRYFCALSQDGFIQVYDLDCSFLKNMKVRTFLNSNRSYQNIIYLYKRVQIT